MPTNTCEDYKIIYIYIYIWKTRIELKKIVGFAITADHKVQLKESEKNDKYLDLARKLKKTMENESNTYTNCNWCSWYSHRRIIKGNGGLGNKRASGDHSNFYIIEMGQNTQNLVKDNQLTLMRKTFKDIIIIIIIVFFLKTTFYEELGLILQDNLPPNSWKC